MHALAIDGTSISYVYLIVLYNPATINDSITIYTVLHSTKSNKSYRSRLHGKVKNIRSTTNLQYLMYSHNYVQCEQ